jgi:acetyl esterase/lipase
MNATSSAGTHAFDVEEVEYLRHGDAPLLARIFRPRGAGPFPALVECHGGAWCQSNRFTEKVRHKAMAARGIVSIALDFRSGDTDPYPASVQDINYAMRWAKLHWGDLKTRPELIGLSGQSSGGHLAMLVAMRPADPRYAAFPLTGSAYDARAAWVVMCWPVINPLSRYRLAKHLLAGASPPAWPAMMMPRQESYWRNETAMEEGSPLLALARGEKVVLPPAIWFQGRGDDLHDYKDPEGDFPGPEPQRFADLYRKAGGDIALEYIEAERHTGHTPDLSKLTAVFERMAAWVKERVTC